MIYKILGTEISVATANTVGTSSYIRCYNSSAAGTDSLLTVANTGGTIGTITVAGKEGIIIHKERDDTVQGTGILAVPVAITG